jgi:hypothetical protein
LLSQIIVFLLRNLYATKTDKLIGLVSQHPAEKNHKGAYCRRGGFGQISGSLLQKALYQSWGGGEVRGSDTLMGQECFKYLL